MSRCVEYTRTGRQPKSDLRFGSRERTQGVNGQELLHFCGDQECRLEREPGERSIGSGLHIHTPGDGVRFEDLVFVVVHVVNRVNPKYSILIKVTYLIFYFMYLFYSLCK